MDELKEYEIVVWERVKHVVRLEARDSDEALDMAILAIEGDEEDTIYDREFASEFEVTAFEDMEG